MVRRKVSKKVGMFGAPGARHAELARHEAVHVTTRWVGG